MNQRFVLFIIIMTACFQPGFSQNLEERIRHLPGIISIEKIGNNLFFEETLVIMIKQPLDHQHPEYGSFPQRIILSHLDYDEPVVLITEGYNADSEAVSRYLNELCPMLNANQLFVEHRYFGKSRPDSMIWKFLTVENAAADHHHINQLFKQIYPEKWISTGISKGGQATLYYRLLYPDDVAETVAYVAPLNFSVEDKRHDKFIRHKAGSSAERKKVMNFQCEVLKRKSILLPLFENLCNEKKYLFRTSIKEIFDYCVLEYSFSFWQWGHSVNSIPGSKSPDKAILDHFIKIVSPDYFDTISGNVVLPFFVQAVRQLGYYAYNPKPFQRIMELKDTRGYAASLFVPKEALFPYDPDLSLRLKKYLKHSADNILLIYGENDPWSASAVKKGRNREISKIVMDDGFHLTRINTLPEKQRDSAIQLLKEWLN